VVNDLHQIVGYKTWTEVFGAEFPDRSQKINAPVVIMAGGKGTRLKPFTDVLPKPLIPVNDIPVVEHIIEKFTNIGCSSIYLTVNYKAKILKAYFEELSPKYKVTFIDEPEPLGTAGSLNFLSDHFNQPIFVTNCDIIIKSDYREIYKYHESNSYDITVVASIKNYVIPYGTCELNDDGSLNCINEKPKYEFLINTGLYVVNPEILSLIPKNRFFHFTHLITKATSIGKRVGVFPVNENSWIDIGQWKEYRKAGELL